MILNTKLKTGTRYLVDSFTIEHKKAIVTGGSRGLGKGVVEAFLACGAEVVIIAQSAKTVDIASAYASEGFACHGVSADLGDRDDRKRAFGEALAHLGGDLDILVNAAGIQRRHKSEEFPIDDWDAVLEINLTASFELCQMAAQVMLPKGYGKIINFASLLSFFGGFTIPAYAASKGGITQLTKAFSNEWASRGLNINAIAPGYMQTEMNSALLANPVRYGEITARIPANRWGTPEDMAGIALFLASKGSDYINGVTIPVDGGYTGR
ncbi:MAG: SDR family oxidoreductase [Sphaerochaetaceae bacterium]